MSDHRCACFVYHCRRFYACSITGGGRGGALLYILHLEHTFIAFSMTQRGVFCLNNDAMHRYQVELSEFQFE
jgi:hypothetical protein